MTPAEYTFALFAGLGACLGLMLAGFGLSHMFEQIGEWLRAKAEAKVRDADTEDGHGS